MSALKTIARFSIAIVGLYLVYVVVTGQPGAAAESASAFVAFVQNLEELGKQTIVVLGLIAFFVYIHVYG